VVASEEDALILELNLIKKFQPHFNIQLKDDKGFPYLKIDLNENWPRVRIVRNISSDGAHYFGPFANQHSIKRALDVVKSLFPFRSCDLKLGAQIRRPCLEYDMRHCVAPCAGKIIQTEYIEIIHNLILFLEGRQKHLEKNLHKQMLAAAEMQQYERAAWIRDQIKAVQKIITWQKMAIKVTGNKDVIAFATDKDQAAVQVFFVRDSKLIGRDIFTLTGIANEPPQQIMTHFLQQYYSTTTSIPPLILLQHPVNDQPIIQKWLTSRRGGIVNLRVPKQGAAYDLLRTVEENAVKGIEQLRIKNLAQPSTLEAALTELKNKLNLPAIPARIEGYDVSNIQGQLAVGSMVVFENGLPAPSRYRRFRIRTVEQANDFAMLEEVLLRRFSHIDNSLRGSGWPCPDLILIDGGKGQLSSAHNALKHSGNDGIFILGLAKEHEEIFLPEQSKPINLPVNSPGLQLLQQVRDEAHRFAIGYHRNIRKHKTLNSALDDVPGIGLKRRQALLRHFGTFNRVKQAGIEELMQVRGITDVIAKSIKEILG
ncbi:MAG: excinuclease ABC subunit UvrC, partial [Dehalococcoidia bacterium]|nr:excinuclease ABC subunit UvrC [Dehalococcoidia bacterium]